MGGEYSKKSGEIGEKIAEELFNLIGWKNPFSGFDVDCINNKEHKLKGREERKTHGIDLYFRYKCPLSDRIQENVVISVKNRDSYPIGETGKRSEAKSFLKELSQSIECLLKSQIYKENKIDAIKQIDNAGVLFWINRNGDNDDEVIKDIANMQLTASDIRYPMYIVDNKVANFLYQSVNFAKHYFEDGQIKYLYPNTGYNNSNYDKTSCGELLPVQYINSHIIPFKEETKDVLIITVMDKFNREELPRLIALAQDLTSSWGSKIVIAFPDYDSNKHGEDVIWAKNKFQDQKFIDKIEIRSYGQDFRNLKED